MVLKTTENVVGLGRLSFGLGAVWVPETHSRSLHPKPVSGWGPVAGDLLEARSHSGSQGRNCSAGTVCH